MHGSHLQLKTTYALAVFLEELPSCTGIQYQSFPGTLTLLSQRSILFDSSESHYPANFQTLVVLEVVNGIEMHSGQE